MFEVEECMPDVPLRPRVRAAGPGARQVPAGAREGDAAHLAGAPSANQLDSTFALHTSSWNPEAAQKSAPSADFWVCVREICNPDAGTLGISN